VEKYYDSVKFEWRLMPTPTINAGFAIGSPGASWRLSATSDQFRVTRVIAALIAMLIYFL
jgi:hypothetical protein